MRTTFKQQLPLTGPYIDHEYGRELAAMSEILDANPEIAEAVEMDLLRGEVDGGNGRPGMTADEVLRALIVKQLEGFSYEQLAFHLADSTCYRAFCRLGAMDRPLSRSALQENISRVRAETLERVNRVLIGQAREDGVETGRKVRVDCTVVDSNIHDPTDSALLWDSVRALARVMHKVVERFGATLNVSFTDHTRRAKRRFTGIRNARKSTKRVKLYRDLVKVTRKSTASAERIFEALNQVSLEDEDFVTAASFQHQLEHYVGLANTVISQTERRVFNGERLPPEEKVVSIFEPHTDIIIKDRRETLYGHKVCFTMGASSLVLDCVVEDGNPADSTLAVVAIERQKEIYKRPPRQAAFDGGFASKLNVAELKELGVKDVAFSKRRGIEITDMVKSTWVYNQLKRFRAGIEGLISFLKRCVGLGLCTWKGLPRFKAYVWSSVVSANLLLLARHRLA